MSTAERRVYKPVTEVTVSNMPSDYAKDSTVDNVRLAVEGVKGVDGRTLSDIYNKLDNIGGSVTVTNFPSDYPLPSTQVTVLKNKVRLMAWDSSQNKYILVEGYDGGKSFSYDANGNLTEITFTIVKDDGTTITIRRTFTYDAQGNLTQISKWEVV